MTDAIGRHLLLQFLRAIRIPPSLPAHHRLRRSHVVVPVVHSHHHHVLGRSGPVFSSFRRDLEVVFLTFRVGLLPNGLHVFPIPGIHRVPRTLDRGVAAPSPKVHVDLTTFYRRRQIFDPRRSRIHLKPTALSFRGKRL